MEQFENATPDKRFIAYLVDWIAAIPFYLLASLFLHTEQKHATSLFFLTLIIYLIICFRLLDGRTLGMLMAKTRLVMVDGSMLTTGLIVSRSIIFVLAQMTILFAIPNIYFLWRDKKTTWLDLTFKTRVINESSLITESTTNQNHASVVASFDQDVIPLESILPIKKKSSDQSFEVANTNLQSNPQINSTFKFNIPDDKLNTIYALVAKEIEQGKYDQGLLARASVEACGDQKEEGRYYMQLRVKQCIDYQHNLDRERVLAANTKAKNEAREKEARDEQARNHALLNGDDSLSKLAIFKENLSNLKSLKTRMHPARKAFLFFLATSILTQITRIVLSSIFSSTPDAETSGNIVFLVGFVYLCGVLGSIWWGFQESYKRHKQEAVLIKIIGNLKPHVKKMGVFNHKEAVESLTLHDELMN